MSGRWVEVAGFGDAATAFGLDVLVPRDAKQVAGAAAGGELAGVDPVVDHAGADAEPFGGVSDTDLAVCVGVRGGDVVGMPDPLNGFGVEWAAVSGGHPGGVEHARQLVGGGGRAEPGDHLDRGRGTAHSCPGVNGTIHSEFVGCACVPTDPDPGLVLFGFGEQGDAGDHGA